jgi:hypothetical protein
MSDYLTNLASRTLNLQEVVLPKRLSLFEPPLLNASAPVEVVSFRDALPSPPPHDLQSGAAPSQAGVQAKSEPVQAQSAHSNPVGVASTENDLRSDQIVSQFNAVQDDLRTLPQTSDAAGEKFTAPESESSSDPKGTAVEHQTLDGNKAQPRVVPARSTADKSVETSPIHLETFAQRLAQADQPPSPVSQSPASGELFSPIDTPATEAEIRASSNDKLSQEFPTKPATPSVRRVIVEPKIAPARDSLHQQFPGPGEMQAETTINVTIGRVEVRAVQPPASQLKPPRDPTRSVMPLEEYLGKRRRGSKR